MKTFLYASLLFCLGFKISAQTTPTGTSTETGQTMGALSVSLTGGATYSIPISVPPGVGGVVPQIALTYNSQGINSVAGYGWNLSGVSAISRIGETKFHDNKIGTVDFNMDHFALDGQRLIVKSGTSGNYGADGTVYETEIFSNVKVTSKGVHPAGAQYGPAYFTVEYPDGSFARYSVPSNSTTIDPSLEYTLTYWQSLNGARIWYYYDQMSSNHSNVVSTLTSIRYGSINTLDPINEITFIYGQKNRNEVGYVGGVYIYAGNLLKEIRVKGYGGTGYRNYYLTHDATSLGYNRLTQITEKTGDDTLSYNPTVFTYDTTTNVGLFDVKPTVTVNLSGVDSSNTSVISGDFDGDGQVDILAYPTAGVGAYEKYRVFTALNPTGTNNGVARNEGKFENIFPSTQLFGGQTEGFKLLPKQGWTVVKFDITTNTTSFQSYSYSNGGTIDLLQNRAYQFPTNSYSYESMCLSHNPPIYPFNFSGDDPIPKDYLSGDFNGDGLTDIMAVDKTVTYPYIQCTTVTVTVDGGKTHFINLDKRLTSGFVSLAGTIAKTDASRMSVGDYNGDEKSDIIVVDAGEVSVYTYENNALTLLFHQEDYRIKDYLPVLFGDYNGDRKMDFAQPKVEHDDIWRFFLSTGTSIFDFFEAENTGLVYSPSMTGNYPNYGLTPNTTSLNELTYLAADVNGDGKTDIIRQQNLTAVCVHTSNGCDYSYEGTPEATKLDLLENLGNFGSQELNFNYIDNMPHITGVHVKPIPILTNHNSINQNLEYSLLSNNKVYSFTSKKDNRVDVRLKTITVGNGVKETITYSPLKASACSGTCNTVYNDAAYTENYPNTDIVVAPSIEVVTKIEEQSASQYKRKLFAYYGAVSNVEGLGFLGFRATMQTNWHNDQTDIISYVSKNDITLRGMNVENYSCLGLKMPQSTTPTTFISKDLRTYNQLTTGFVQPLLSNKVYKLMTTKLETFNGLEFNNSVSTFIYDSFNNPTSVTTLIKQGPIVDQQSVINTKYEDLPMANPYIIGRAIKNETRVTVYPGLSTEHSVVSEENISYQNNLPIRISNKQNNMAEVVQDNFYDDYGNITKQIITTNGITPREKKFTFDAAAPYYGRFLTASTDTEGLTSKVYYDPVTGAIIEKTDPFDKSTNFDYDKWQKKVHIKDYLGNNQYITYVRNLTNTFITTTDDEGSSNATVYDDLGRGFFSGIKTINGQVSCISKQYDIYNRDYKISEPFYIGASLQWNEKKYDSYGRVTKNNHYTGKTIDTFYTGVVTVVTESTTVSSPPSSTPVKTTTYVKNAIGNIVSVSETPGTEITYTYFADGQVRLTNCSGAITEVEQDDWGRKTKLTDPSAGIYKYEYNNLGEITNEIVDGKATTRYTYDDYGKITKKTIVGIGDDTTNSETGYSYDPDTKQLISIVFKNNTSGYIAKYSYQYDNYQRLNFKDESAPEVYFSQSYEYDNFGRIKNESHNAKDYWDGQESNKYVNYTYKNGFNYQMKDSQEGGDVLRQINTLNARGQVLTADLGLNMAETRAYDNYGFPSQIAYQVNTGPNASLTPFLDLSYSYNRQRGNLSFRINSELFGTSIYENFGYDNLDRLIAYPDKNGITVNQSYDNKGNITSNPIGNYSYTNSSFPYRATSVELENPSDALDYYTNRDQQIIYNAFKAPVRISEQGHEEIDFEYNAFERRAVMYYGNTKDSKLDRNYRKYYSADGSMEIRRNLDTNKTDFVTYLGGDGYSAVVVFRKDTNDESNLFLHRDNQGSILAITTTEGQILEKRAFDAWGEITHFENAVGNTDIPTAPGIMLLDRGYTGHEHLLGVGLINMNSRLYDPKLHRFLGPDGQIMNPMDSQSYNRYGYAMNNPLRYTDPSGETGEEGGPEDSSWQDGLTEFIKSGQLGAFKDITWENVGNSVSDGLKDVGDLFSNGLKSLGNFFGLGGGMHTQTFPASSASFLSNFGGGNDFTTIMVTSKPFSLIGTNPSVFDEYRGSIKEILASMGLNPKGGIAPEDRYGAILTLLCNPALRQLWQEAGSPDVSSTILKAYEMPSKGINIHNWSYGLVGKDQDHASAITYGGAEEKGEIVFYGYSFADYETLTYNLIHELSHRRDWFNGNSRTWMFGNTTKEAAEVSTLISEYYARMELLRWGPQQTNLETAGHFADLIRDNLYLKGKKIKIILGK